LVVPIESRLADIPSVAAIADPIETYDLAIAALEIPGGTADSSAVLNVLVARDSVSAALKSGKCAVSDCEKVRRADARLRKLCPDIADAIAPNEIELWRSTFLPGPEQWWWRPERVLADADEKRRPWWPVVTGVLLIVSASLTAEIARRFLANGPDFYGSLSTISQGALTLIAGSSLTQTGRTWLSRLLKGFGIDPERHQLWHSAMAAGVLALVSLLYLALPWIALYYYDARGVRLYERGERRRALDYFQRAVSLAPSEFQPHYDLGNALEDTLDTDRAIGEYQASIASNPRFYNAYNNVARLYFTKRKDPESALRELRYGIDARQDEVERRRKAGETVKCPQDPLCIEGYSLHKNRAWVDVEMKWYDLARNDITEARRLFPDGPAPFCLLAKIDQAEGRADSAKDNWTTCLQNMKKPTDLEEIWIGEAKQSELGGAKR
jgi:tetratricopeptide (TPR) repeat protein